MGTLTMNYHEHPGLATHAEHDEAFFQFRVTFIKELERELVIEYRSGLNE